MLVNRYSLLLSYALFFAQSLFAGTPVIVILDTGVCSSQTEGSDFALSEAFVPDLSRDFISGEHGVFRDEHGHGTHLSGIVWRELKACQLGEEPRLVMLRVGKQRLQVQYLLQAFEYLASLQEKDVEVSVVLCAFALNRESAEGRFTEFSDALLSFLGKGGLIISAAAGRGHDLDQVSDTDFFLPGCLNHPNILTITSCSTTGFLSPKASYGQVSVFGAAPGSKIESCWLNGESKRLSGSSQAAAHFAARTYQLLNDTPDFSNIYQIREQLAEQGVVHPSLLERVSSQKYFPSLIQE